MDKKFQQARLIVLFLFLPCRVDAMEFGIFLWRHFLDLREGVEDAEDEDGGAEVEAPYDGRRYHALGSGVGYSYPGEEDREKVADKASRIAQE